MLYFKRPWDETRGGSEDWGVSTWYFETESDLWPTRQIEIYANGNVLHYDGQHVEDGYGGLSQAALDADDFATFAITAEEFEKVWVSRPPINR